jgi:hypothetical protein
MTAIQVRNDTTFGAISNKMVDDIMAVDLAIKRLQAASAAAASGYAGTAGTEYETGSNFGVLPSGTPGVKGADYQFALATLATAWATFMTAAQGSITALDNG